MKEEKLNPKTETKFKCPRCNIPLLGRLFHNIEVDNCPKCLGLWFEEDELRLAKDDKDRELRWLDINLWDEETQFRISSGIRLCPSCRVPLYEVRYGSSDVIIDVCSLCKGIWLDNGEFKGIIDWLKAKANREILDNYTENLLKEFGEIFVGPETTKEEILDFLMVLKLLNYKVLVKHPNLSRFFSDLPK
ncbi:MAG: zf-TFIIB domain-containing protein [Candidatus Pacebacteria bacterium]|jgi:Zn-finger nucleic acid-binding protein|nr:zf-TFIIB domain-containing protein [Candidatus Paceibacterota bacterium]MDD3072779.1 zf-TFIIB domain-containing protein [Candidatus Paceibacterota bacterium]MDD3729307.1 zf-TFIIB domain-containing protein [Candidatus Paceibacterota bacterium]MDD4201825.1 zf-TFIIB domain-containing protein [Candidatus Paceibacterota bacterium]MDD4467010.1 zf-TFIIB domain-containing protein [Candidatus Paceibacterota bacterium]